MEKFSAQNEKQNRWNQMTERILRTIDGLGMPIDEGIKELVIALNLLGYQTTASCEGHVDWATGAPYIDFGYEGQTELDEKLKSLPPHDHMSILLEKKKRADAIKRDLKTLLDEFYAQHASNRQTRLHINPELAFIRLESAGAEENENQTEEIQSKNLLDFQEEMRAFSQFLKQKFYRT